jgi:hypothetical protein
MEPGLTAFTRMWRAFKSVVHVRANERTAAFVALYTLFAENPLRRPVMKNERAFVHELLRGREADAARAAGHESNFSFKLVHALLPSPINAPLPVRRVIR